MGEVGELPPEVRLPVAPPLSGGPLHSKCNGRAGGRIRGHLCEGRGEGGGKGGKGGGDGIRGLKRY